jgi:hypothetical protein
MHELFAEMLGANSANNAGAVTGHGADVDEEDEDDDAAPRADPTERLVIHLVLFRPMIVINGCIFVLSLPLCIFHPSVPTFAPTRTF